MPDPVAFRSAAAPLLGPILAVAVALAAVAASAPARADGYDDFVRARARTAITFGHDVDIEAKVTNAVKTAVDKLQLGVAPLDRAKAILVNGFDYWNAAKAGRKAGAEPALADFDRYFVKSMLDSVSPKELVRIKRMLGDHAGAAEALKKAGIDVTEAVSEAAPEGELKAVVEAAMLAGLDALCEPCAVARAGAMAAIEEGRRLRAAFQDERTRALYEAWKQDPNSGLPQGLRGGSAPYEVMRGLLEERRRAVGDTRPVGNDDVERAMIARFAAWQRGEAADRRAADRLAAAKAAWNALSEAERGAFGADPASRLQAFADTFEEVYEGLLAQKGDRPFPAGGEAKMIADAVRLAVARRDGTVTAADYRDRFVRLVTGYGWPRPFGAEPETTRDLVSRRLAMLDHEKLQALFDHIAVPQNLRRSFYGCLCASVPHGPGVSFVYAPGPGRPCVSVGGLGTWREAFPANQPAFEACFAEVRAPGPGGGTKRFDEFVADLISGGR